MTAHLLEWIPGPLINDFPDKSTKLVNHANESIVVIHWDGEFTAFRNECLHQEMPLHAGYLAGGMLLCPWHNWGYDVRNGACATVRGASLKQFPVRADAERLWIGLPAAAVMAKTTDGNNG